MNGKRKGSQYERDLCRKLSLWISGGKNPNLLWRSAMSGGRSTLARKKGGINKEQAGDISAIDPMGNRLTDSIYIEAKNYKDIGLAKFFMGLPGTLTGFWKETVDAAKYNEKTPMLLVKQNFYPELIIFTPALFNLVIPKKQFDRTEIWRKVPVVMVGFLDDFLDSFMLRSSMVEQVQEGLKTVVKRPKIKEIQNGKNKNDGE
jgi:hypothetical protein